MENLYRKTLMMNLHRCCLNASVQRKNVLSKKEKSRSQRNLRLFVISRIIPLNYRRGGSGAGWKTMFFLLQMVTMKHLQKYQKESRF